MLLTLCRLARASATVISNFVASGGIGYTVRATVGGLGFRWVAGGSLDILLEGAVTSFSH